MSALINENKRLFTFQSPMGSDLLCNSFEGAETISELFEYKLELVSESFDIAWSKMLGKNVTVGIRNLDGKTFRYFNGHISRFTPIRHDGRLAYYSAEMVPWPWFLTLTQDCLVYQNQTVEQVITKTFQKFGFQDWAFQLKHNDRHTAWEYCCQYRETSLAFISRLMEMEGMYYYFEHQNGKHKMTIVDDKTAHVPCPGQASLRYDHNLGSGVVRDDPTVFAAEMVKVVKPARYFHKEFNFKHPDNPLEFWSKVRSSVHANQELEVYDYPGDFEHIKDGMGWSVVRQLAQEADRIESRGKTNGRAMNAGYRVSITQHDREEQNIDYLITSVTHSAHEGTLLPGSDVGQATYENKFVAIPSEVQFSPKKKTRETRVAGSQTAIVVGPAGEDIHTDEYGRVRVRFHWDRTAPRDDNSCWIRVMQTWAGNGYGQIWIPRIGQEVIVDFLEGDPDRPIITGCVYNQKNQVPYKLPDKKNWSGVKTRSTIGGTAKNYNELRFVDTKGDELFVQHAEKDMEITVNHDTNEAVDHDRTLRVKHDQVEMVENNKMSTVQKDRMEEVQGDKHNTVDGEFREEIGGDMSLSVKGQVQEKAAGRFLLQSDSDIHLKAGGRIILEAAGGILFLGQGGFIDITDQVIIQGNRVLINCGMPSPGGATSADPQAPDAPTFAQSLSGGGTTGGASGGGGTTSGGGASGGSPASSGSATSDQAAMQQALASNPYVASVLPESGPQSQPDISDQMFGSSASSSSSDMGGGSWGGGASPPSDGDLAEAFGASSGGASGGGGASPSSDGDLADAFGASSGGASGGGGASAPSDGGFGEALGASSGGASGGGGASAPSDGGFGEALGASSGGASGGGGASAPSDGGFGEALGASSGGASGGGGASQPSAGGFGEAFGASSDGSFADAFGPSSGGASGGGGSAPSSSGGFGGAFGAPPLTGGLSGGLGSVGSALSGIASAVDQMFSGIAATDSGEEPEIDSSADLDEPDVLA